MRVLITGAAGKIGQALREGIRGCYEFVRLTDIRPLGRAGPGEECVMADLADAEAMTQVEIAVPTETTKAAPQRPCKTRGALADHRLSSATCAA